MEVTLDIVVRSTEIDVNGHVNNAKYLEYLEWGREEWYERHRLDYDTFLSMGVQTVTVNININYRQECKQGDKLTIRTNPKSVGTKSYILDQSIINQNGITVADATVTSVCIDSKTRKSTHVPEELRQLFTRQEPKS